MSRVLGLDWGTRRIGVAVSDAERRLAVGYAVWSAEETDYLPSLVRAIGEEDISLIVVGLPLTLSGEEGVSAQAARAFAVRISGLGPEVMMADERMTSFQASRSLSQAGINQKKQRGKLDMAAAVLLLQSFLDEHQTPRE
ncbi:MAG: Holliday junction resolvase RuvX [Calditrichaeota bacterium]|nr:Holliday junction resolvase RuvX [Calditrichota bacterium]MCB9367816.1 Holliday junction resolvase RuvX [Calditrichota bacterium]